MGIIIGIGGLIIIISFALYAFYDIGKEHGRREIASGEVKMFLCEFNDKTRGWYKEDELSDMAEPFTIVV